MAKAHKKTAKKKKGAGPVIHCTYDKLVDTGRLKPNPHNPNTHPEEQVDRLALLISKHGWRHPITVSKRSGFVVSGHCRLLAAQKLGLPQVPVDYQDFGGAQLPCGISAEEMNVLLSDNAIQVWAEIDGLKMADNIVELDQLNCELELTGLKPEQIEDYVIGPTSLETESQDEISKKLVDRFIVPPFSVLDARQGYWQDRKKQWIALGIEGESGRTKPLTYVGTDNPKDIVSKKILNMSVGKKSSRMKGKSNLLGHPDTTGDLTFYKQKREIEKKLGRKVPLEEFRYKYYISAEGEIHSGTSIFDPVLCEIMYCWFCPINGSVLDPFAGESTKGIVANYLGYKYTGIELRAEQVQANENQAKKIGVKPKWIRGDAANLNKLIGKKTSFDFIFTSPPYFDLEQYSNDKRDGSAKQTFAEFMVWYKDIFEQAVSRLRDNRFLAVKVGEIRDKKGIYRSFVPGNVKCFTELGLCYYNELILVTAIGSLPIRIGNQFQSGRKIGKTHQNILVFYKGNPKEIKNHFDRNIEIASLPEQKDQG